MKSRDSHVLRIGTWRVDPALDEICTEGTKVKLQPRNMRRRSPPARHAGQVVKEQLVDELSE